MATTWDIAVWDSVRLPVETPYPILARGIAELVPKCEAKMEKTMSQAEEKALQQYLDHWGLTLQSTMELRARACSTKPSSAPLLTPRELFGYASDKTQDAAFRAANIGLMAFVTFARKCLGHGYEQATLAEAKEIREMFDARSVDEQEAHVKKTADGKVDTAILRPGMLKVQSFLREFLVVGPGIAADPFSAPQQPQHRSTAAAPAAAPAAHQQPQQQKDKGKDKSKGEPTRRTWAAQSRVDKPNKCNRDDGNGRGGAELEKAQQQRRDIKAGKAAKGMSLPQKRGKLAGATRKIKKLKRELTGECRT